MSEYEPEYEPDEPLARSFCDNFEVHESHVYLAINGNLYDCDGLTTEQLDALEAYDPGICEHGLSADLCAGPGHYPPDGPYPADGGGSWRF